MSEVRMKLCILFGWALSRELLAKVTSDMLTHSYILKLQVNPINVVEKTASIIHSQNDSKFVQVWYIVLMYDLYLHTMNSAISSASQ